MSYEHSARSHFESRMERVHLDSLPSRFFALAFFPRFAHPLVTDRRSYSFSHFSPFFLLLRFSFVRRRLLGTGPDTVLSEKVDLASKVPAGVPPPLPSPSPHFSLFLSSSSTRPSLLRSDPSAAPFPFPTHANVRSRRVFLSPFPFPRQVNLFHLFVFEIPLTWLFPLLGLPFPSLSASFFRCPLRFFPD